MYFYISSTLINIVGGSGKGFFYCENSAIMPKIIRFFKIMHSIQVQSHQAFYSRHESLWKLSLHIGLRHIWY